MKGDLDNRDFSAKCLCDFEVLQDNVLSILCPCLTFLMLHERFEGRNLSGFGREIRKTNNTKGMREDFCKTSFFQTDKIGYECV